MELEQLIKLAKNLHDHFHMKRRTNLTNDEYRLCQSLLSNDIDLNLLYQGLVIISNDVQFFGNFRVAKRN